MKQKKTFYEIAEVVIAIEGSNECAEELRKYFEQEKIGSSNCTENFLIQVNMEDNIEERVEYWSLSKSIAFNEFEYRVNKKHFVYSVSNLFNKNEKTILRINWKRKDSILNYLIGHLRPKGIGAYKNSEMFVDSVMNYEVFLYVFPFVLMKYNKVFIHSGVITQGNEAVIMAGTSGCGKTSALMEFLNRSGCKYVADDFGILDSSGQAWFIPKKTAIYQSDAKYGNMHIVKALKNISLKEKFFWQVFKLLGLNPRCRFSPYELFNEVGISKKAKLKKLVYLTRKNTKDFNKTSITHEEITERIMISSFRELKELNNILGNIRSDGDDDIRVNYPAMEILQEQYKTILYEALKEVEVGLLELPINAVPSDIVDNI